jgi:hypothetical protein
MTKENASNYLWLAVSVVLALAVLAVALHDVAESPEIVTEYQTVVVHDTPDCPVQETCAVCEVCAEPVVCPVYSDEFVSDYAQDLEVKALFDDAIAEDDFAEDLMDWMNINFGLDIEDIDDMSIEYNKNYELSWDDREEGEAVVSATLKVYYEVSGEDEEFERLDVEFVLDDEDLEEFDSYEFEDY